jgi:hypothetical protein
MTKPADAANSLRDPRTLRWGALLLALLLHAAAFQWANGVIGLPSWHNKPPEAIAVELKPPPPPAHPQVERAVPEPKPTPKPKPPHLRKRPPAPPPPPEQQPAQPAAQPMPEGTESVATEPGVATDAAALSNAQEAAPDAKEAPAEPVAPAAAADNSKRYNVAPPPPAELEYDVYALREGQQWHGTGDFRWELSGNRYSVTGEASIRLIFKISVLNFKSEGEIDDFGVAPLLYSEKPFRKSLTNTHFQHAGGKISFSASEATYPYRGGEQDRGSIIWQLAGIGRADASQFAPGTDIDVVVAGNRDADTWHIKVIGQEDIDTGLGRMTAWHVSRAPRPGSYDQAIDIWFAPQREWYPVKVRYTYVNGDYLELSASSLTPLAAQ